MKGGVEGGVGGRARMRRRLWLRHAWLYQMQGWERGGLVGRANSGAGLGTGGAGGKSKLWGTD